MTNYGDLVREQREYWNSGATRSISYRIECLKKLKKSIKDRYDDIIVALQKDLGKAEFEAFTTEIMGVFEELNYAIKHVYSWSKPKRVKTAMSLFKSSGKIYSEPYGCVLVITAWNYPFALAMIPLIGAIAAGNCCMIKPSELAPNTSAVVTKIIGSIYEEKYCTVVEGGVEASTSLLEQKFDMIHYTGSEQVGKIVAQAAAKHLTPVVLELGGKSPCIVDSTADMEVSARRIIWGKFTNAGQTCTAPDYLLVHHTIKDKLIAALQKQLIEFYGDSAESSSDYSNIVNSKHFDRIVSLLNDVDIVIGGKNDKKQLYIEPTLVNNVKWDDPIMKDEIFGPILPILTYYDLDEIIKIINSRNKPLALYYFSKDKNSQQKIINEVPFGGGCINATLMHNASPTMPFGGVGNSGMGNYHGKYSFDAFSHQKSILKKSLKVDFKFPYPPYRNKGKLIKRMHL